MAIIDSGHDLIEVLAMVRRRPAVPGGLCWRCGSRRHPQLVLTPSIRSRPGVLSVRRKEVALKLPCAGRGRDGGCLATGPPGVRVYRDHADKSSLL